MTQPARRRRPAHVPALDGVRGVALAAVLLYHAGRLRGGYLGVDLFFVLSGYLITTLLLLGWRADRRVDLRRFWARRVRRLLPALVMVLVAVGIFAAVVALPVERRDIRWDGLATLGYVANWRTILAGGDYWHSALAPSPLQHTWSLAIEEQFYVLWPIVVAGVLAWRRSAEAVLAVAAGLAALSVALVLGLHVAGASDSRLYLGTDTRIAAILFGATYAAIRFRTGPARSPTHRSVLEIAGVAGAAILALAWLRLDGSSPLLYTGGLTGCSLAGAAVVAATAERRPLLVGRVLGVAPLRALGIISYGAYLWHWPIYLVLTESRTGLGGWPLAGLRIVVTLVVAAASWALVEQPIRAGAVRGRQARAAVPAAAACACIALLAGTIGARAVKPVIPAALNVRAGYQRAHDPNAATLLVAGDSVPLLLALNLAKQRDELHVSLLTRAVPGCDLLASVGPIRGVEGTVRHDVADCSGGATYRDAVQRFRPQVAMLMFGEFPNESVEVTGRWVKPCDPDWLALYEARISEVVRDLRSAGSTVVLATAPGSDTGFILDRVAPGMARRVACVNDVYRRIADREPGVSLVDLARFICPAGQQCLVRGPGGENLRPDGLHFDGDGARYVNRWLIPRVLRWRGKG